MKEFAMINRRHVLGLAATACAWPARSFATVAPQRSEIRDSLVKRFTDEGTMGTFVGYKVEDYLIIASDKTRSGEGRLPASTFRDIDGGIDQFWLSGDLRIDPMQQIDFLDRLRRRALSVSKRSQDLTCDILPVTKAGDATIRAKSGLLPAEAGRPAFGWMVGWAEKGNATTVFALNVDCIEQRHVDGRMALTQACLGDIGSI
jgi:beta-lactamase class D